MASGGVLKDVELRSEICAPSGIQVHSARSANGADFAAVLLPDHAEPQQAAIFDRILRFGAAGGLTVERADDHAVLASPCPTGTVAHLPSLGWRLQQRLDVFGEVLTLVSNFHRERTGVGALDPQYILLDEDLRPFFVGPAVGPLTGVYCAPEAVESGQVSLASDVFALGRLLHFIVSQEAPAPLTEDVPRLESLVTYPAGLSRIIRKAVARDPKMRYRSLDTLMNDLAMYGRYEDVGLAHPDADEKNLGGTSLRPAAPVAFAESVAPPPPGAPGVTADWSTLRLTNGVRWPLLLGGAAVAALTFFLAYLTGSSLAPRTIAALALGAIGFALFTPGVEREMIVRIAFGAFFLCASFAFLPLDGIAERGERRQLNSSDLATRKAKFLELRDRSQMEFADLDLSGAKFPKEQFIFLSFDNVSFENADLRGARFLNTLLSNVNFSGSQIGGAWFEVDSLNGAVGFKDAFCNEQTRLPPAWDCTDGHPRWIGLPSDAPDAPEQGPLLPTWGSSPLR